ncbi:VOC family protein, partial [Candidatus Binatia bacterium]|nr:VOC family protein [Candidatus Binatia bacterium]
MDAVLDHVVLAVRDLAAARADYAALLGRDPSWQGRHPALGTRNVLFRLADSYLELLAPDEPGGPLADVVRAALHERAERPFALALGVPDVAVAVADARARGLQVGDPGPGEGRDDATGAVRTWRSALVDPASVRGVRLLLIEHTTSPDALPPAPLAAACDQAAACAAIDHVVLFTEDVDASVATWTERVGLPLAWRRDFPERATRNAGVALGSAIVELIQRTDRASSGRPDVPWGVAYRVPDVAAAVARLAAAARDVT